MYKIVSDSSCDVPKAEVLETGLEVIPFKLFIDGDEYIDELDFDVDDFREKMIKSKNIPKSACPSPSDFLDIFKKSDTTFVVTISSPLSGTYNSAMLGKGLYEDEGGTGFVHIFDSKGTSGSMYLIIDMIRTLKENGSSDEEVVEKVEKYIADQKLFFILESLDNLMKNGRISKVSGTIASALNVVPIMRATEVGEIDLVTRARGKKKAYNKLVDLIQENVVDAYERKIVISHANNEERAMDLKEKIEEKCQFKEVIVLKMKGLTTLYSDNGGIIVSF